MIFTEFIICVVNEGKTMKIKITPPKNYAELVMDVQNAELLTQNKGFVSAVKKQKQKLIEQNGATPELFKVQDGNEELMQAFWEKNSAFLKVLTDSDFITRINAALSKNQELFDEYMKMIQEAVQKQVLGKIIKEEDLAKIKDFFAKVLKDSYE